MQDLEPLNLSRIPKEIWTNILQNLELLDVLNFYRVFPTTIDVRLYNYLPLHRINEWGASLTQCFLVCNNCEEYRMNEILCNLESTCMSKEKRKKYNYKKSQVKWVFYSIGDAQFDLRPIYLRNLLEVSYKHGVKLFNLGLEKDSDEDSNSDSNQDLDTNSDEDRDSHKGTETYSTWCGASCIFNINLPKYIFDEVYRNVKQIYYILAKYEIKICSKCGELDHKEYEPGCLFQSSSLRHKLLEEKRLTKERFEKAMEQSRIRQEAEKVEWLKIACIKCRKNQKLIKCTNQMCRKCCRDPRKNQKSCNSHRTKRPNQ